MQMIKRFHTGLKFDIQCHTNEKFNIEIVGTADVECNASAVHETAHAGVMCV